MTDDSSTGGALATAGPTYDTLQLAIEIFDVLERHGIHQDGAQSTGRAVHLVMDLARVYSGGGS